MDDDEYERRAQEYYDRKTKHREEIIPYILILFYFTFLLWIGFSVFTWLRNL
jgi:hypothetical protein